MNSSFLAQANSAEFLEKNRVLNKILTSSFDGVWTQSINSNLFVRISFYGAVFALCALAIFAYQWLEYELGRRGSLDWATIIIPVFLIILLAKPSGGGTILLGKALIGFREIANSASTELLNLVEKDMTTSKAASVAAAQTSLKIIAANALQNCAPMEEQDLRNDCFLMAEEQIIFVVEQNGYASWATEIGRELVANIQDAMGTDYATHRFWGRLFGGLGSTASSVTNSFGVPVLFLSMGYGFYWMVELGALLSALTSPLFLGISLFSIGHKPFLIYLSLFSGIWFAKFCYSIVIGFTGLVMSLNPLTPAIFFPLIAGFFGPLIALVMAGGGGLALFSIFTGSLAFAGRQ